MRFLTKEGANTLLEALKLKSINLRDIALFSLLEGAQAGEDRF